MIAVYIRVSTTGQKEASQRREIQRWLDGHGLDAKFFVDKKSGDNLKRPAFERLQKAVFAGEMDTIVVYKLDRISRSLRSRLRPCCFLWLSLVPCSSHGDTNLIGERNMQLRSS